MITIRPERPDDMPAVQDLNKEAFGQPQEAGIVDALRSGCPEALSLVAVSGEQVLGHIMFSPVTINGSTETARGMGLAPMAVLSAYQQQGIGSKLVEAGLEILRHHRCPFVIVLGHPQYYPRFGFVPASRHGLTCQWEGVPDEAFMVLLLDKTVMAGVSGVVRYRHEFDEVV